MSDNTEFDPFANAGGDVNDAIPSGDDVLDGIDTESELDDLFADAELEMSEEESDEEVRVYDAGDTYTNPLDVGLKDKMWVPIRITTAAFKEKHKPRLSAKTCVAMKIGEDGKKRVYIPFDQVEAQIQAGATEVVGEYELPYFICEANHVAPEFGQRRYPYEIEVPALTIKTAYFKQQRSGRTGFKNEDGRTLRVATQATKPGEPVNLKTMPGIAERMAEQVVMAQITLSTKSKSRPRLDGNNQPISVLLDTDTGAPVTVFAVEKQVGHEDEPTTYLYNDGSGRVYEGSPKLLIKVDDRLYAIADKGDNSGPLMEEYSQTTDYLKTKFLPVPERKVEVEMRDGSTERGEITWGTVGAIAQSKTPGTPVDILMSSGDKIGKTITAVWLGTQWIEVAPEGGTEGGGLDEFAGASNL